MKIIDMHLNPVIRNDLKKVMSVTIDELMASAEHYSKRFGVLGIEKGVMVILNQGLIDDPRVSEVLGKNLSYNKIVASYACDFRSKRAREQLETAKYCGVAFLKFHPYMQQIDAGVYSKCGDLARTAEGLGMKIMVCCSHGTRALEKYSGVRLTAYLAEFIKCPIVMSHAGGSKILDAMHIAEASRNVFLDTSFSLSYYGGSSIESDMAFAMKKLGANRWVYGSDAPFVDMSQAINDAINFMDRYKFKTPEIEAVLYMTAKGILDEQ